MKILVCGGRNYGRKWDYVEQRWKLNFKEVRKGFRILSGACREANARDYEIIHGAANGADSLAAWFVRYCRRNTSSFEFNISETSCPADWKQHKKAAGPIRNREMLKMKPDVVIAFPGGNGTKDMIYISKKANIPVYEVRNGKG